jgi:excisionase family DNA binding protein
MDGSLVLANPRRVLAMDDWLTVPEVAKKLRIGRERAYQLVKDGEILDRQAPATLGNRVDPAKKYDRVSVSPSQ